MTRASRWAFARTYALGLYEQRSGATNAFAVHPLYPRRLPYGARAGARAVRSAVRLHVGDHRELRRRAGLRQPGPDRPDAHERGFPALPLREQGHRRRFAGGHHDAGDYSGEVHHQQRRADPLSSMFTVDSIPRSRPRWTTSASRIESGDGIKRRPAGGEVGVGRYISPSCRMPTAGSISLTYPKNSRSTSRATFLPDHRGIRRSSGRRNTFRVTAVPRSPRRSRKWRLSPRFKAKALIPPPPRKIPRLQQAQLGLAIPHEGDHREIRQGGRLPERSRSTGDRYMHDMDELAWAATEMFLATGDTQYAQALYSWFPNPSDPRPSVGAGGVHVRELGQCGPKLCLCRPQRPAAGKRAQRRVPRELQRARSSGRRRRRPRLVDEKRLRDSLLRSRRRP